MTDLQAKRLAMAHLRLRGLALTTAHMRRDIELEKRIGMRPQALSFMVKDLEATEWALKLLRGVYKEKRQGVLDGKFP